MAAKSFLAVLAHPDDETFLMGGTLALLAARGWNVSVLTVTNGERGRPGRYADEALSPVAFGAVRREELNRACRRIGVRVLPSPGCPDGGIAVCQPRLDRVVRKWIEVLDPHVVVSFGHDGVSGHPDHVAVGQATHRALRSLSSDEGNRRRPIEFLWVLRSEALPECCRPQGAAPAPTETLRVDIRAVAEKELLAMAEFESQAHLQPRHEAERQRVRQAPERFHRVPRALFGSGGRGEAWRSDGMEDPWTVTTSGSWTASKR